MDNTKEDKINFDDVNFAIYKLGVWKNNYEINQIGLSDEIPVTENTKEHVIFTMDEIRRSEFEIEGEIVNGFVAIAYQLNPKIKSMDIKDAIALEEKEYCDIVNELNDLELLSNECSIERENSKYLIYKLKKECHVTISTPVNGLAVKHYMEEMSKIESTFN